MAVKKIEQETDSSEEHTEESQYGEEESEPEVGPERVDEDDKDDDDEDESSDDDEEEEEESGGYVLEDKEDESENDGDESQTGPVQIKPVASSVGEQCTFDLKHLMAVNSHQVNPGKLYGTKKANVVEEGITIPAQSTLYTVDEEFLLERASDGCAQLISALWQLPMDRGDAGPMLSLPPYAETKLPRELPPPPPIQETKWEKFAKERGIPLNKNKRSRKVWDEATQTWMYRTGYQKANNDAKEWPIMEVKDSEDPFEDPWERIRDAKRARVEKNAENRMRNAERAGALLKGTATRTMKNLAKVRQAGKEGGNRDRDNLPPSGVPVDLGPGLKEKNGGKTMKRGRENTIKALIATQISTASMGKFDKMREGEPERKKAIAGMKKRKFQSATDKKVMAGESERGMKVLNAVLNGGGVAREKDARKGRLAGGETAYDYDFDDGLGASTFRKKKGRGGAGKLKKMTKKRVS